MRSFVWVAATASLAAPAWAEAPKVVTDIAPVHSLVAQVMQGVGAPTMLIDPGASPHGYALRPSQARALSDADAVFWIGEALTPWMEQPMESLAAQAVSVELLELEATLKLEFRETATFEGHDHDEAHGHDDHDDHDKHGHDDHDDHDDHDEHGHDDHAHDGVDPHAWLDPVNAIVWTQAIADELSRLDPENAGAYAKNAAAGIEAIEALSAQLAQDLDAAHDLRFVVFHDAYHYFENRFGLAASGAISVGDAVDPSAARVAEVRDAVSETGVTCVFAEPQFNPGLIRAVSESGVKVAQIDPLGVGLDLGPDHYGQTMRKLSASILGCLE